jgi:hypothetical protein
VVVTGRRLSEGDLITAGDVRHDRFVLLRKGRKRYAVVDLEKEPV